MSRAIVKHSYLKAGLRAANRARAHVRYIQFRPGPEQKKSSRLFFNDREIGLSNKHVQESLSRQKKHGVLMHKLILSPGSNRVDMEAYTREIMASLSSKKGLDLEWYAVTHDNTAHTHCHIVIMGTDRNGRRVRLDTKDYALIKEVGDKHLEKEKVIELEKELDKRSLRHWYSSFLHRLRDTVFKFKAKKHSEYVDVRRQRQLEREQQRRAEVEALGDHSLPPRIQEKRANFENRRRDILNKERKWKAYCKPILVSYSDELAPVEFTWRSSIKLLREVEADYLAGDARLKEQLNQADFERLQQWIKDQWKEKKKLEREAEKVTAIELNLDEHSNALLHKDCELEYLQKYQDWDNKGKIFLCEPERHALNTWIQQKKRQRQNAKRHMRQKQKHSLEGANKIHEEQQ